jgi:hypothetical protein
MNAYLFLAPSLRVDSVVCLLLLYSLIPWTRECLPFLKHLRVSSEERLLASSCPPVFPLSSATPTWMDFRQTFYWELLRKSIEKPPDLVKIGHKYRTVYVQTWVCFNIVPSDACIVTIHRTHCCVSVAPISIFITLLRAPYVHKNRKGTYFLFSWQECLRERVTMLRCT